MRSLLVTKKRLQSKKKKHRRAVQRIKGAARGGSAGRIVYGREKLKETIRVLGSRNGEGCERSWISLFFEKHMTGGGGEGEKEDPLDIFGTVLTLTGGRGHPLGQRGGGNFLPRGRTEQRCRLSAKEVTRAKFLKKRKKKKKSDGTSPNGWGRGEFKKSLPRACTRRGNQEIPAGRRSGLLQKKEKTLLRRDQ